MRVNILAFVLLLFLSSCELRPCNHYFNLNQLGDSIYRYKCLDCNMISYQDIEFKISHENPFIDLQKYWMRIYFEEGEVVYNGRYKRSIRIDSLPVCSDDGRNMVTITIVLIDSMSKMAYSWENEDTYDLEEMHRVRIKLKSNIVTGEVDDGAYSIYVK